MPARSASRLPTGLQGMLARRGRKKGLGRLYQDRLKFQLALALGCGPPRTGVESSDELDRRRRAIAELEEGLRVVEAEISRRVRGKP
jgi:hypothetical protein